MGRWSEAWRALTSGPSASIVAPDETKGIPADLQQGFSQIMGATRLAPKRGTRELLTAYQDTPWLHSVTRQIGDAVAGTAWTLDVVRGQTGKALKTHIGRVRDPRVRRSMLEELRADGKLTPVLEHPLLELLEAANPDMSGSAAMHVTAVCMLLKGELLWILERNAQGMPINYRPIPPHWVMKVATLADPFFRISAPGWGGDVPASEVIWFRHISPLNPYGRGVGTGEALADEIDTDEFAAKRTRQFFQNGALPEAVISVEGATNKTIDEQEQRFNQQHRGFWNAYKAWWTGAKVSVTRLDTNFKEMNLVGLREFERDLIGQTYGWPPELRGIIENSNRATIEAADYIAEKHVVQPQREFFRSELQLKLVPQFDDRLILGYANKVPEDREFQRGVMIAVPACFTVDEIREFAGQQPLEDGSGEELYKPAAAPNPFGGGPGAPVPVPTPGPAKPEEPADPEAPTEDPDGQDKRALPAQLRTTVSGIVNALESLRPERLSNELEPVWEERVAEWGQAVLDELGVEGSFDMLNPRVQAVLAQAAKKVTGINDTTRADLRATLMEGVAAGEGVADLAKRVRETFAAADGFRSETIALTEVLSSANSANLAAWNIAGVVEGKRWVHNPSSQPRETHEALDGTTVGLDEDFVTSDGARAQAPGSFGLPEEDIRCRCGLRPVVSDPGKALSRSMSDEERATFFKSFEDRAAPWEKAALAAIRRGFRAQRDDVLAALEKHG